MSVGDPAPCELPGARTAATATPRTARDAGRDLAFGSACIGCAAPGRVLCLRCASTLPRSGVVAWPTPAPAGLAVPFAGAAYDGLLKTMVNQHKERGVLCLAVPLGRVLAEVVHTAVDVGGRRAPPGAPVVPVALVPVPSRRPVVRRRGHDPLLRVTRVAAVQLRRHGVPATVRQVLRPVARVRDQSTLDAAARATNLASSMAARPGAVRRVAATDVVMVVDDVLTTGATAREAQRALEDAGLMVSAIAVVAATRRRTPPAPAGP